MAEPAAKTQQGQRLVKISRQDLPLACPLPQDEVWNMHPRVYLPIDTSGEEVCPYCGTRYLLED